MNTDIAVPTTALRVTCSRRPISRRRSPSSSRAVVDAAVPCRCSEGSCFTPRRASSRSPRPTWRSRSARRSRGRGRRRRERRRSGTLLTDLVRLLPDDSVTLAYDEGEGVLAVTSGQARVAAERRTAPRTSRDCRRSTSRCRRSTRPRSWPRSRRSAARRRETSRARCSTGVLVRFEGDQLIMAATDSYRLAVKETALTSAGPELDAIIPARALQEPAPPRRLRPRTWSSACTRTTSSSRPATCGSRADASTGSSRTTSSSFPRLSRSRSRLRASRCSRSSAAPGCHGAAKRTAATALRRRQLLTVSAQTQDVGEATESLPIEYAGEETRDRLQSGLPARRVSRPCHGDDRPAQAHQPPATRTHRSSRRELLVPDHAHPPRGLIVREVTLRDFRSYAAPRARARCPESCSSRPERRREDEPPRGAPRRHAGVLAARPPRRADDPLRRRAPEASRFDGSTGRRRVRDGRRPDARASRGRVTLNGERLASADRLRHELDDASCSRRTASPS